MSLPELSYDKDWTRKEDFPTYEGSEDKVRADLQYLFDQILTFLNETYSPAVLDEIAQSQTSGIASGSVRTHHFDHGSSSGVPKSVAPYAGSLYPQRAVTIQDNDGSHSETVSNVDFSGANTTLKLPSTIKATVVGSVSSANTLSTARSFVVKDATEAHTGASVNFDGSGNVVLKIPATIAAALVGNADTATKLASAFSLAVSDGTHTGTAQAVDGSTAVTLTLPTQIVAELLPSKIILDSNSFGNRLPATGEEGQLFFVKET